MSVSQYNPSGKRKAFRLHWQRRDEEESKCNARDTLTL